MQIDGFELRSTAIHGRGMGGEGRWRLMKSCPPETHLANSPDAEKCKVLNIYSPSMSLVITS